jgi:hypothetical protein
MSDVDEVWERVRRRAYEIWERSGRPDGLTELHWLQAKEEIAIEDGQRDTLLPNPAAVEEEASRHEPVEELTAAEEADLRGFTDQGEKRQVPMTRAELHRRARAGET